MWFKKSSDDEAVKATEKLEDVAKKIEAKIEPVKPAEEWIWVEGYKATDKNMVCRGYRYTLGELHNMPNEAEIKECESGFHLCKDLEGVFGYYDIIDGHRFFKVRALVRKSDYERLGCKTKEYTEYLVNPRSYFFSVHQEVWLCSRLHVSNCGICSSSRCQLDRYMRSGLFSHALFQSGIQLGSGYWYLASYDST